MFQNSAVNSANLEQGSELFKTVSKLVQAAAVPVAERLPRDISFTYRGAAILPHAGGHDSSVFWYGYAETRRQWN